VRLRHVWAPSHVSAPSQGSIRRAGSITCTSAHCYDYGPLQNRYLLTLAGLQTWVLVWLGLRKDAHVHRLALQASRHRQQLFLRARQLRCRRLRRRFPFFGHVRGWSVNDATWPCCTAAMHRCNIPNSRAFEPHQVSACCPRRPWPNSTPLAVLLRLHRFCSAHR
jgi:hypothetical protein